MTTRRQQFLWHLNRAREFRNDGRFADRMLSDLTFVRSWPYYEDQRAEAWGMAQHELQMARQYAPARGFADTL